MLKLGCHALRTSLQMSHCGVSLDRPAGRQEMAKSEALSRREREMMNIIFRNGKATANEVMEHMTDAPSYSAVRATLRVLEQKGHVKHQHVGARYVYLPTTSRDKAGVSDRRPRRPGSPRRGAAAVVLDRHRDRGQERREAGRPRPR